MATTERPPTQTVEVENPATGQVIRSLPVTTPDGVEAMVARARAAQPAWEALGFEGRGRVLRAMRRWLVDNSERVIETIVGETGKAYEDASVAELAYGAGALGFWAKRAPRYLADEKVRPSNLFIPGRRAVVRYRPVGVVGVIGPWNYPLNNTFGDAIPALAAGNTVVMKPSEVTPLTSLLLAEGLRECGAPEDVLQVAIGAAATATALIDAVDFVMFTGSWATGRKVMARAAETLTPVALELGGKDPMIVLADADLERAANAATYYAMQNAGQTCISVERVYVEDPVYDRFVDLVSERVRALRQGAPDGPGSVDVGAVTFPPQLEIVSRHVDEARAAGARVTTGGRTRPGAGRFYEPTVLADVDHSMSAMTEETFGPTLPVMKVADAEQAIRMANDSVYGLGASVWTKDRDRGRQIAGRLESGYACVNDVNVNYFAFELPMGGWKQSGLGVRHGAAGIRKYTRQQAILITRFAPKREPHYFPYRAGTTKLLGRLVKLLYGRGSRS
jgi:acyl-CoA reductase-like NAD-dependent aldehyde dehydrogenase